jgi:aspartate kinase
MLQAMEDLTIDDVSLDADQARVSIRGIPDRPGLACRIFEEIARAGIFVDMIVQSSGRDGSAALSFTVPKASADSATKVAEQISRELGLGAVSCGRDVAKLSVGGIGLRSHTGVAIRAFRALASAGVNLQMINTSEVRVNVTIDGRQGQAGFDALEAAFADVRQRRTP